MSTFTIKNRFAVCYDIMFALFAFYHDNYSSLLRKRIEKILVINLLLCYLEKTMLFLHDDEGGRNFAMQAPFPLLE